MLTTLWTTTLIIASNVVIFALTPVLSLRFDRHHHRSSQHVRVLRRDAGTSASAQLGASRLGAHAAQDVLLPGMQYQVPSNTPEVDREND